MAQSTIHSIEYINANLPKRSFLIAIQRVKSTKEKRGNSILCKCKCGQVKEFRQSKLLSGRLVSCGCFKFEIAERLITENINVYSSWRAMISRCTNPKDQAFHYYGGRGVTVCKEWLNSFESFLKWSKKNGWKKGLQIDKDINGNGLLYSPDTCKWVTAKENNSNRRNTKKYLFKGEMKTLKEISEITGILLCTLWRRVQNGVPLDKPKHKYVFRD